MAVEGARLRGGDLTDRWLPRAVGLGLTFVLWLGLATWFERTSPVSPIPYPVETLTAAADLYLTGAVFAHLLPTLSRIVVGFAGAMVLGTVAGVLMGTTAYGEKFLSPFVVLGLALPSVALAAMARLVWGFSFAAPTTAAAIAVSPFVAINVWKGVENLDRDRLEMARSFGVSNRRLLRRVLTPDVAPALFAASRFGVALSWKVVTVTEVFAAASGVGYRVNQARGSYQYLDAGAWVVAFMAVVVLVEYGAFKPLERRAFAHRDDEDVELTGAR
ncbi:ABC transporter permease [Halolamina salifodinae]|uniref:ABC-type nitrate/sulfonate/bicarbonate transport system permease component n=1 Tax=Halolamina salifodinae TaxID=1202767 RepID=A0A8T4GYM2_9EURY|nr:ABC transporter permease subunit [Halolamina salifodinae]MBP1986664.1 ABC-type nitrate/sulfonate/bicarbonate transport system permease component [Halolamina salifodinae]